MPKRKSRPHLAEVFRRAEDINAAVRIMEDVNTDKGAEGDSKRE